MGTAYKALLPYQTFRTQTRDLALAVGSDRWWKKFCPLMGLDDMTDDPRFATNAARNENRRELIDTLQTIFWTQSYEAWEALFLANGIPVGAINTIDQVVEHPQLQARGMRVESEHPVAGMVKLVGPAVKLSDTPGRVRNPAPTLGQHTDAVLREMLDMDTAAIEALREAGAVGPKRS
jgi:crotonobetainyl-CoA:carnitine CoA-transferase CaiB-like acyl-CoA transferase